MNLVTFIIVMLSGIGKIMARLAEGFRIVFLAKASIARMLVI